MNVCLMENLVILLLLQCVLCVVVDCLFSLFVFIECLSEFEEKFGLLFGCIVLFIENLRIIVMNLDIYSKFVYKVQIVGLVIEVKDYMSILDDSNIDQIECINVNYVLCENLWNIGQLDEEFKFKLLNLLLRYKEDVFIGLGCVC